MATTRISTTEVEAVSLGSAEEEQVSADTPIPAPSNQWITDGTPDAAANWSELLVREGQAFENADAFRLAVFKFLIANRFHYRILHNKPKYISIFKGCDGTFRTLNWFRAYAQQCIYFLEFVVTELSLSITKQKCNS
ncbi:hypothetical protein KY290_000075 [Solanum tuberosum]|uniref:Uncharacterized protein n=1 Tax=Solanum tuberosum TaxID=4113 RepID=A0ABQ7WIB1_SOLTU|nr:hypothetical protein KY290_000075 [Solanum tuberosum]